MFTVPLQSQVKNPWVWGEKNTSHFNFSPIAPRKDQFLLDPHPTFWGMQGFACCWHISVHKAAFADQNSLDYFQVLYAFQKIAAINLMAYFV